MAVLVQVYELRLPPIFIRISEGLLPRVPLAVQKTISSLAAFIASVTGLEKGLAWHGTTYR
jgi:hypothetical protein